SKKIINTDGLKLLDPVKADSYKRTSLSGGELLICVRGTTGTIAIASSVLKGANVTRGIVPVSFDPLQSSQNFGYYSLISPVVQKQIKAKTYGAALMQINIRDLRKLRIPLPHLSQQKDIVSHLNALTTKTNQLQTHYQTKLTSLTELKKSILQKAFAGELT
ncbi:MAG: restriction endonuclease subunit S, partial [Verrucomicrobiales bacterium]|nr:restriction endonuclease subunit S [Verrucomicrobiales bacterium]